MGSLLPEGRAWQRRFGVYAVRRGRPDVIEALDWIAHEPPVGQNQRRTEDRAENDTHSLPYFSALASKVVS